MASRAWFTEGRPFGVVVFCDGGGGEDLEGGLVAMESRVGREVSSVGFWGGGIETRLC